MRILHVITTMDRGGAENHLAALANAQVGAGMAVGIAFLKGDGAACPPSVPHRSLHGLTAVAGIAQLRNLARGADLVHAHLPRAELASVAAAKRCQPLIISRHNAEPFLSTRVPRASQALARGAAGRADAVIAISNAVRSYHLDTGHLASGTRLEVIPYGHEPQVKEGFSEDHWVNGLGRSDTIRIACVARLTAQKDLPTLVQATAQLCGDGFNIDLRIAGDGPDRADLLRLVDRLELHGHVSLIGRISDPETFIAGADIFALPSKYEGLGLVLLEAMGVGTPIVAARNTAIAEVVVDEETGLLFRTGDPTDLASQIKRLALDPSLRATLSAAGAERLRSQYSVDRMLQQTMSVYERALERAT